MRGLGKKGITALVCVLTMTAPLSTDMYLPALPEMCKYFQVGEDLINLTLSGFFLFFSLGMLLFGPISDKYGRKKVLIVGLSAYIIGSILCALSVSIAQLIILRIFQALGAGCMVAVSTAIVKDNFSGIEQARVLATSQTMIVIAPMAAPIVGAWVVNVFNWRITFVILAIIGIAVLILTTFMKESLPEEERYQGFVLKSFSRIGVVLGNKTFTSYLCVVGLFMLPIMAYISTSSYIYMNFFGLSATMFSLFFAIVSGLGVLGPIISVKFHPRSVRKITSVMFLVCIGCGTLLLLFGTLSPLLFLIFYTPASITAFAVRPYSTVILMNQQKGDSGTASGLINFGNSVIGFVGMILITAVWTNYIQGLSILLIISSAVGLLGCGLVFRKKAGVMGPEQ